MNKEHIRILEQICGGNSVITTLELMASYLTDWRKRYTGNAIAVVFPTSTLQIKEIINYCHLSQIAIVPQGGNTSNCGAATPLANYVQPQIIVNLQRMNRILAIDKANQSITVEAGATLDTIHKVAEDNDLYFPLSIASSGSCQIGGNLATNAGGSQVLKYGMMRDLTLGLEAILADGKIINSNYKLRKNNTYFDLKQLFIGSEGTLGIITKATLKLYPKPYDRLTFMLGIDNLSQGLQLLEALRCEYLNNVSTFEIIKDDSIKLYNQYFVNFPLPLVSPWSILGELEINSNFHLDYFINLLTKAKINLDLVNIATTLNHRNYLWYIREHIPLAEKEHGYAVKHDISLPLGNIEAFLALNMPQLLQIAANGYFSIFGHLGDGNLHYNFGIKGATEPEITQLEQLITPLVYQDVVNLGGSISAEHGIGQAKKHWFRQFCSPDNYALLHALKKLIDPDNMLNPGKIF